VFFSDTRYSLFAKYALTKQTLSEAWRILKRGGRLVIVDYHRPSIANPLYWPMVAILKTLEPFALDLWRHEIRDWLPGSDVAEFSQRTSFGGLYQLVTLTKRD